MRAGRTVIGRRLGLRHKFFCHGQKRDYLSRVSQRARGATKNPVLSDWRPIVTASASVQDITIAASIRPLTNI